MFAMCVPKSLLLVLDSMNTCPQFISREKRINYSVLIAENGKCLKLRKFDCLKDIELGHDPLNCWMNLL